MRVEKLNFLGKTMIFGLSVTCLGALSGTQTVQASTKVQYKNLKATQYTVVKGSKGYLYKDATLKHKLHSVKNYSKVKFVVSKEAIVKKSNGKRAIYYRTKSGKVTGWIWHGYLAKVSVKKSTTTQNTDLQQQIANLQQQISDLRTQLSNLKMQTPSSTNTASVSTSTDVSSQIADLQNQINSLNSSENSSGATTSSTSTSNVDKEATTDPVFNGTPTQYYINTSAEIYLYPDNQAKKYPTIINDAEAPSLENNTMVKTLQVYSKPEINKADEYDGTRNNESNRIPVEYNGQKGYVDQDTVTVVPVNEPFYRLGNKPDYAGWGNVAPTEVKFINPLVNGSEWTQYSKDGKYGNKVDWNYNATTKAWTKD